MPPAKAPVLPAGGSSSSGSSRQLLKDFVATLTLNPAAAIGAVSSGSTVWLLVGFGAIGFGAAKWLGQLNDANKAAAKRRGYKGDAQPFDGRFGYTPDEADGTLAAWGPEGRQRYLWFEAVDAALFITAYRGFCIVAANWAVAQLEAKWPGLQWLRPVAALPVLMADVDYVENTLQSLMVVTFPRHARARWWRHLVGAASVVNRAKWLIVIPTAVAVLALSGAAGLAWGVEKLKKQS